VAECERPARVTDQSSAACWLALQDITRLLDDAATEELVKGRIKHDGGIKRLEKEPWPSVSAPQS
jgi:hypothetical protein